MDMEWCHKTVIIMTLLEYTVKVTSVKPLNKGHVGDSIDSALLSFIEKLSSFRGSQCIKTTENFWDLEQCTCNYNYRGLLYSAPIVEGPLSEVPLYPTYMH